MTDTPAPISQLHVRPDGEHYTAAEMDLAARTLGRTDAAVALCRRILIDGAMHGYIDEDGNLQTGGYSFGAEMVDGKPWGAIHIYNTCPVYRVVPNPQRVAEVMIDELDTDSLRQYLQTLLEKVRTDWYMTMLGKWEHWDHIKARLEVLPDGFIDEVRGSPTCDIRRNPPDSKVEVLAMDDAEEAAPQD